MGAGEAIRPPLRSLGFFFCLGRFSASLTTFSKVSFLVRIFVARNSPPLRHQRSALITNK